MAPTTPSTGPLVAGVDIGGTNTRVGILDQAGGFHGPAAFPTQSCDSFTAFIESIARSIDHVISSMDGGVHLAGVGVAAPAGNSFNGTIQSPANLAWGTVNIKSAVETRFRVPVTVSNDAAAAALGEYRYGAGRGTRHCIVVTLGTGLGAGFIVEGVLLHGAHGLAGELGHVILEPNGRLCGCGRRGCAETYASATGLKRTLEEVLAARPDPSALRCEGPDVRDAASIFRAARDGDALAREAFTITGGYLGRLLANIAAVFDPDVIILSGGLMNAGPIILDPTLRWFNEQVLPVRRGTVRILQSRMTDGEAAMRGAAALAARAANAPGSWIV